MRGPGSDEPNSIKDQSLITGRKRATYIKQVGGGMQVNFTLSKMEGGGGKMLGYAEGGHTTF